MQGLMFDIPQPKYGFKADGSERKRPLKEVEFAIFDMRASDVPDDHPDHVEFQRLVAQRCEEIQAGWTDSDWERRRCYHVQPLTFEEMSSE